MIRGMLGFACINMQSRKIWVEMEASNRIHIYWDWNTSKPLCLPHNLSKSRLYSPAIQLSFFTANCSHSIPQRHTEQKATEYEYKKYQQKCDALLFGNVYISTYPCNMVGYSSCLWYCCFFCCCCCYLWSLVYLSFYSILLLPPLPIHITNRI